MIKRLFIMFLLILMMTAIGYSYTMKIGSPLSCRKTVTIVGNVTCQSDVFADSLSVTQRTYMAGGLYLTGTASNIVLGTNYLSGDGDDEGVYVLGTGLVGVGTSNPGTLLQVGGNGGTSGTIRLEASDGDEIDIAISTADELGITGGWVGIGTANPASPLDVYSNTTAGIRLNSTFGTNQAVIYINNTGGDFRIGRESSIGGIAIPGTTAYDGFINVASAHGFQIATNSDIKFTILAAGNIGIDTTSPVNLFTVNGTARITDTMIIGNSSVSLGWISDTLVVDNNIDARGGIEALAFYGDGSQLTGISAAIWSGTDGDSVYVSTATEVGIGTDDPSDSLDVQGGILGETMTIADTIYAGDLVSLQQITAPNFGVTVAGAMDATGLSLNNGSIQSAAAVALTSISCALGTEVTLNAPLNTVYQVGAAAFSWGHGPMFGVEGTVEFDSTVYCDTKLVAAYWISGDGDEEGIYIDGDGEVGIGTSVPTERLDVEGNIELNGNKLKGIIETIGFILPVDAGDTFYIEVYANYDFNIDSMTIVTDASECTATITINSVAVTGLTNINCTTTITTWNASGANSVSEGDIIQISIVTDDGVTELSGNLRCKRD